MIKKTKIVETKKPDVEAIKNNISLDRDSYQKRLLDVIIEKSAMEKEIQLIAEKEAIDS
jgi:hypothetical protein